MESESLSERTVFRREIRPLPALSRKGKPFIIKWFVVSASEKVSENLHIISNEPSLACYRLHEHVKRSLPLLINKRASDSIYIYLNSALANPKPG
ncbi:MEF2BNB [Cordylochernes scorpioides]|uniref:MEF2BNB n=1 Tax=Cordylochernes scorpioides TaxID=51811 RepID=A0ABY6KUH6_9ARAC|nr:MEF2BNB [Cordylochernes scorpioides]